MQASTPAEERACLTGAWQSDDETVVLPCLQCQEVRRPVRLGEGVLASMTAVPPVLPGVGALQDGQGDVASMGFADPPYPVPLMNFVQELTGVRISLP